MSQHKKEERNTSIKEQRDSSVLSVSGKCGVTLMLSSFLFVSDNLDTLVSLSSEIHLPAPNSIANVKGFTILNRYENIDVTAMVSLISCPLLVHPFEVIKFDFFFLTSSSWLNLLYALSVQASDQIKSRVDSIFKVLQVPLTSLLFTKPLTAS